MSIYTQLDDPSRHWNYSTAPSISPRKNWRVESHNFLLRAGATFIIDERPSLHKTMAVVQETYYDVESFKLPFVEESSNIVEGSGLEQRQISPALEQGAIGGSGLPILAQGLNVPPQGDQNGQLQQAATKADSQEKTAPKPQKKEGWLLNFVLSILFNLSWVFRR